MKKRGIFVKVFFYTVLFLVVVMGVTAALFAQQIVAFYNYAQTQQLYESFAQLREQLSTAEPDDYAGIAKAFSDNNQSYNFLIQDPSDRLVFVSIRLISITETEGALAVNKYHNLKITLDSGYTLSAFANTPYADDYSQLWSRLLFALVILLALGTLGAVFFARQMTKPIHKLVGDAEAMSLLAPVSPPEKRNDEIGELTAIVHAMYGKLKDTIADLEEEKETQRYFFAAASHELKTPIAATIALLQGMFDNVGEYKDHPKYLWECLKMMGEQNKIISEILEIVKLTDNKMKPTFEHLVLSDMVDAVLPLYQTRIDKKALSIAVRIPTNAVCKADYGMLQRVLSNIIQNAVQHTPFGGTIRIWSQSIENSDYCDSAERCVTPFMRLCILNTGVHIDESILPKIFDPFFRVDEARTIGEGSSGLGLTIVAKMLGCMQCAYALENTDEGVLFRVDLPV